MLDDRELALGIACPTPKGCGSPAGQGCRSPRGNPAPVHRVRLVVARGGAVGLADAGARPSQKQAGILAAAVAAGGIYWVSQYDHHGDAARRRSMRIMVDRGWFELRDSGAHDDRYEITNLGRNAYARYQEWMNGGST
jgi:hypothetical protein